MKWIKSLFEIKSKTRNNNEKIHHEQRDDWAGLTESSECDEFVKKYVEEERKKNQAGSVKGRHYTEYVKSVQQLKREKKYQEVIDLLLMLIDAVEREAKLDKACGGDGFCAPWYYEQLAIIYRKEKQYSEEVLILERLQEQNNYLHETAVKRLEKARELLNKGKEC
jgi:hypothetical protein